MKPSHVIGLSKKEEYEILLKGYKQEDVTWMTSKRDIAVVFKNKGKLCADVTGKTAGTDDLMIYINGIKVNNLKVQVK